MAMLQGLLLPATQAGLEMIKVGGAVVGFWFLRGTEQLAPIVKS
jgi:hypothetical protein